MSKAETVDEYSNVGGAIYIHNISERVDVNIGGRMILNPAGAIRDRGGPHPRYVFRGGRGLF